MVSENTVHPGRENFEDYFSFLILNPFKNCIFSSCYHALLGVAIFIFIKRSKIIKAPRMASRIHLYKKRKFRNLILDPLKAFYVLSGERLYFVFHPKWSEFSVTTPMYPKNAYKRNDLKNFKFFSLHFFFSNVFWGSILG